MLPPIDGCWRLIVGPIIIASIHCLHFRRARLIGRCERQGPSGEPPPGISHSRYARQPLAESKGLAADDDHHHRRRRRRHDECLNLNSLKTRPPSFEGAEVAAPFERISLGRANREPLDDEQRVRTLVVLFTFKCVYSVPITLGRASSEPIN